MPITIRWDDDAKTCIYYEFVKNWTWDEFNVVFQEATEMLDTVSHKVDSIVDLSKSHLLPTNTLTRMRYALFQTHPNGGIVIFIIDTQFARSLFRILTGIFKRAKKIFRIAPTLEMGYKLLEEYRNQENQTDE